MFSTNKPVHSSLSYRPEIDGLRAVAVIPIVLYHAGFALFSGGFVGVDVFFVISGYLITSILLKETDETGRISIVNFYRRRIRRIAPALLIVLTTSTVAAYLMFLPDQLVLFCKALIATLSFGSNIWFWSQTGYFTAQGGIQPLLHTWSLAVEEQFYLFAPIVVWLLSRRPAILRYSFVAAALLSFCLSAYMISRSPSVTFYWLPTRAWELLIGSILALKIVSAPRDRYVAEAASLIGLAMIGAGIFVLDETMPFPGALALLPCVGTAFFIYGTGSNRTFAGGLVSSRPMVTIGLISYSLYLWHWPVIIFLRQATRGSSSIALSCSAVLLSLALAALTFRFIERPTRMHIAVRPLLVAVAGATVALVATSFIVIGMQGMPGRIPTKVIQIAHASKDRATLCAENADCQTGSDPSIAIVGDSHAALVAEAFDRLHVPAIISTFNACAPLIAWTSSRESRTDAANCQKRNERVFRNVLTDAKVQTILLVGNWRAYASESPQSLRLALSLTTSRIRSAGKRVVIFQGTPYAEIDLPWASALAARAGADMPIVKRPPSFEVKGAETFDVGNAFCAGQQCAALRNGAPILSDGNHLTRTSARSVLAPLIAEALPKWITATGI